MKTRLLLALLLFTFTGCSEAQQKVRTIKGAAYIGEFSAFVDEVAEQWIDYEAENWAGADSLFRKFDREYYSRFESDLSEEEKSLVNELRGRYYAIKLKWRTVNLMKKADKTLIDLKDKTKGFVREMIDTISSQN